jgi:hypothetical protein
MAKKYNKKGFMGGVAVFVLIVIALVIAAPLLLKVGLTIMDKTSDSLSILDTSNQSSSFIGDVRNKTTSVFDWAVMLIIFANLLLLLVSSFLIDVHPAFLIIYIIMACLLVLTAPYTMSIAEKLYDMEGIGYGDGAVTQYIPMTNFVLQNFGYILVGIIVLSGIIIYAKIRIGGNSGGSY